MASQRIDFGGLFGQPSPYGESALANNFFGMFDPGSVITGMSKGDEVNPQRGSAMEALQSGGFGFDAFGNSSAHREPDASGSSGWVAYPGVDDPRANSNQQMGGMDYGIPEWDALFGDDGQVNDADALLRALNVGSLFGDWTNVNDTPYANSATGNPMLDNWMSGLNDFNANIGPDERYFDPNNLAFTGYDLGGVDLRTATLDDLNQWAESQYGPGVDLLTVAASNPELLQARQGAYSDPSSILDPITGLPTLDMIPGLTEEEAALRLQGYETGMTNETQLSQQQGQMEWANAINAMLMQNPEAARTAGYQDLVGRGQAATGLSGLGAQMAPQPSNYEYLFASGLAPQMTAGVLQQLKLQGG